MFAKKTDIERHCEKSISTASRVQGIYRVGALGGAQGGISLLKAVLDQRPCPCFLISHDLTVSLINEAALEQHGKFGISVSANGALRFEDAHAGRRLSAAIKRFQNEDDNGGGPALLSYEGPDGTPVTIVVRPVSPSGANSRTSGYEGSWFLVSVRSSLTSLKVSAPRIAATFHLTPAEACLAAALVEGLSLHEYAEREDLKITTVRWHLQNIFERTGARNQQELISMVVSLFG